MKWQRMNIKSPLFLISVKVLFSCYICIITLSECWEISFNCSLICHVCCEGIVALNIWAGRATVGWQKKKLYWRKKERTSLLTVKPEYCGSGGGKKRPKESAIDAAEDKFRYCFGLTGSLLTEIRLFFPMCWLKEMLSLAVCLVLWSILVC